MQMMPFIHAMVTITMATHFALNFPKTVYGVVGPAAAESEGWLLQISVSLEMVDRQLVGLNTELWLVVSYVASKETSMCLKYILCKQCSKTMCAGIGSAGFRAIHETWNDSVTAQLRAGVSNHWPVGHIHPASKFNSAPQPKIKFYIFA